MNVNYERLGVTKEWLDEARATHAPWMSEGQFGRFANRESGFNPKARGPKTQWGHAGGVLQLLPGTAKELGVTDVYNAKQNIVGGLQYATQGYNREGTASGAFSYHHGGPNKKLWGPKTRAYADAIAGPIGTVPPTVQGEAARIAQNRAGAPNREYNAGMPDIRQINQGMRQAYTDAPQRSWNDFGNIMQGIQTRNKQLSSFAPPEMAEQALGGNNAEHYKSLLSYINNR